MSLKYCNIAISKIRTITASLSVTCDNGTALLERQEKCPLIMGVLESGYRWQSVVG